MKTSAWLVFVVAALAAACGGASTTPQSGSESHFLGSCASTSDCAAGLECACGFCTRSCATGGECQPLGGATSCLSHDTLAAACAAAPSTGLCVASCSTNAECGALACQGGTCRPRGTVTDASATADAAPANDAALPTTDADAALPTTDADAALPTTDADAASSLVDSPTSDVRADADSGICFNAKPHNDAAPPPECPCLSVDILATMPLPCSVPGMVCYYGLSGCSFDSCTCDGGFWTCPIRMC